MKKSRLECELKKRRTKDKNLRRRYGISLEQWEGVCHYFGNQCLATGEPLSASELSVDHVDGNRFNNSLSNFQPLSIGSNSKKGSRNIDFRPDSFNIEELEHYVLNVWSELARTRESYIEIVGIEEREAPGLRYGYGYRFCGDDDSEAEQLMLTGFPVAVGR